jgi:hypothetical protein
MDVTDLVIEGQAIERQMRFQGAAMALRLYRCDDVLDGAERAGRSGETVSGRASGVRKSAD